MKGYYKLMPVRKLDEATVRHARANFARFRLAGTITEGSFESSVWKVNDELHEHEFCFEMDEAVFYTHAGTWMGCTFPCFETSVRAYAALNLGTFSASTLMQIIGAFRDLAGMDYESLGDIRGDMRAHAAELLRLIPEGADWRDIAIEELEADQWKVQRGGPRTLADFQYFLAFGREMERFWSGAADAEKVHYFPVFFWWNLTVILPLRATEFLLTPGDCLEKKEGRCFLTIRRTRLKKGKRKLTYTVEGDYEPHTYEIPEWMYREISWYQEATAGREKPELGTLLISEWHHAPGYFTYGQMRNRLREFCGERLGDKEYPVHLGDTRHLAMINLILSGGSPVICRELAGHEDISISANYYSNLSGIVESVVYEKYHGWGGETAFDGRLRFYASLPEGCTEVSGGWCDDPGVYSGDITGCLTSYRGNGTLGNCVNCIHFYPKEQGLRLRVEEDRKNALERDAQFLIRMIDLVRKGKGYQEDIASAMMRIQTDAGLYADILKKKYQEVPNGKTEKE